VGPRVHLLGGMHTGAIWRISLNRPRAAVMRPFCQINLTTCYYGPLLLFFLLLLYHCSLLLSINEVFVARRTVSELRCSFVACVSCLSRWNVTAVPSSEKYVLAISITQPVNLGTHYPCPRPVSTALGNGCLESRASKMTPVSKAVSCPRAVSTGRVHGPWTRHWRRCEMRAIHSLLSYLLKGVVYTVDTGVQNHRRPKSRRATSTGRVHGPCSRRVHTGSMYRA